VLIPVIHAAEPMPSQAAADSLKPAPEAPSAAQRRVGRFLVREVIGRGSHGVVYAAVDPVLGREVAIKAIPLSARQGGPSERELGFLREAKIAAGLNHPSIVTVFDAGRTEAIAYLAMERLQGSDLHHWLSMNGHMSAEMAAAIMARVADALHFAHRRGLIHRDLKPSNIFLTRDLKPKVLDFGVALALSKQGSEEDCRKLIGTPNYMSPEQAMGRTLDVRSDVFSLGAILYEMLCGERAFDGSGVDEILTKVVRMEPAALRALRPELPQTLVDIVARAMAKNPADRYPSAAHLRHDLAAFAGRPVASAPATEAEAEAPPARVQALAARLPLPRLSIRLRARPTVTASLLGVLLLALTYLLWLQGAPHPAATAARAARIAPP
jgi:serine/threonine-protein kinase